ncbi:MAG: hypothetical protein HN590_09370 [Calditrichaeota bacterium]|nr:hypothetical protein [Calditrichota bacterium]
MQINGNISTYQAIVLILVISAVLISCEQPDGPVGSGVGSGSGGQTYVDTFQVEADTSFAISSINTGASQYVYVGSAFDIQSQGLIRFNRPLLPVEWSIHSAWIELSYDGGLGSDEEIWIGTRLLDYSWSESDPPEWDDVPAGIDGEGWETSIILNKNDGLYSYQLPNVWVQNWLEWEYSGSDTVWTDTTRSDSTMTLHMRGPDSFAMSNLLLRFRSRIASEDSLRPKLFIDFTGKVDPDSAEYRDTLSINASGDLFIVKNHNPETGQSLFIGSGASYKSHIKFDISQMWDRVNTGTHHLIVNRSVLTLHKNLDLTPDIPRTESIWPFKLNDIEGFVDADSAHETGYTLVTTAIDSALEMVEIVTTTPVSEWIEDSETNFGLSLHSATEGYSIDRLGFYSSEAADPALRPRLIIYYTEIPR